MNEYYVGITYSFSGERRLEGPFQSFIAAWEYMKKDALHEAKISTLEAGRSGLNIQMDQENGEIRLAEPSVINGEDITVWMMFENKSRNQEKAPSETAVARWCGEEDVEILLENSEYAEDLENSGILKETAKNIAERINWGDVAESATLAGNRCIEEEIEKYILERARQLQEKLES